ncbi:MAG: MBL fold metallo-hydrolase [Syntrophomonadaceae bacterium]|jgi:phosphoribosyl 1,2-cyclic phosphodiesterase
MVNSDFQVIFWGVRGSIPVPGPDTLKYGGNTSCVQVQIGDRLIIFDAGSGIYKLGQQLVKSGQKLNGDIFITHTHWDHIQGFPFFAPAFVKGNYFKLYGQSKTDITFTDLMAGQMTYQHFPVSLQQMGAKFEFIELDSGTTFDLGDSIKLTTTSNNHPNGGLSYRLDYQGRSCCYITDTEHYPEIDHNLCRFALGSDLIIYDAHFTDEEYINFVGWGHSTWQEGIKLVQAAGAKRLVLFHHANFRTDREMEIIEKNAQKCNSNYIAAREGMVIKL